MQDRRRAAGRGQDRGVGVKVGLFGIVRTPITCSLIDGGVRTLDS